MGRQRARPSRLIGVLNDLLERQINTSVKCKDGEDDENGKATKTTKTTKFCPGIQRRDPFQKSLFFR